MKQENNKSKREPVQKEEQRRNVKERVIVVPPEYKNLNSVVDFEWPEFNKESDRIKAYSKRFADKSIPEIFGVTKKIENPERFDMLRELKEGDTINVIVRSISDNGVVFETVATKQVIQSSINLKRYAKLKLMTPFEVSAVVTKADREIAYVDIIKPIYKEWLKSLLKDPDIQRDMNVDRAITVKNLHLTRGGFLGQAVIPTVTDFIGQEYTVDAFIPGSQIVLNIEDNFEKWNRDTVQAFVTNYMLKPGSKSEMSLICSRKEMLKFWGDKITIKLFGEYCLGGEEWDKTTNIIYDGVVTGIINSSKKCGVFVEIPSLFLTGMVNIDADKLVNYKPGEKVKVQISDFEENTYFDPISGQVRHETPYIIEDSILRSCNVKPILKLA